MYHGYIYPMVNMYHIFFIHSSAYEHLGCFHLLDIVNNAAMNIRVHVSFQISFFKYLPRIGFVGSYDSSVFSVLRNLCTIIHTAYTSLQPHQQRSGVPFFPHPLNHIFLISLPFVFSVLYKPHSPPLFIVV